ncbi:hypothetical protein, partial [Escherichia coli]|uniref:hypothetical protein n=1 Tax=Escherichia coli TaxID=562 RepID=UPI003D02F75A
MSANHFNLYDLAFIISQSDKHKNKCLVYNGTKEDKSKLQQMLVELKCEELGIKKVGCLDELKNVCKDL